MEKVLEIRNKLLEIVKSKGPVLPMNVSKEIGTNILMASAHLAELTASKLLKISNIKVGNSPLYYLPGQESMLQSFAANLNEKEKRAYDLLSESKVLRDREQSPLNRVALRQLKDFALPLNVTFGGEGEIFWKWYLASDEEASKIIKSNLDLADKDFISKPEIRKEEPAAVQKVELTEESIDKTQKAAKRPVIQEKLKEEAAEKAPEIIQKEKTRKPRQRNKEDFFLKGLEKFFEKNGINALSSDVIRKNAEIDFVVEIPSVVGTLQYYCKAKNKKRVSDSDLSSAYVKGQLRKLPVLFISTGDLSSKAEEMLSKELNLAFKKI